MVGVSSRGWWVAWLAALALIALSTLRAASAIPGIDPETADRYKHLKEAIKVKMLAEKVILDNRGWARPRNVLKQIKEYGETEQGSPLWLLGVLPSQYETRCDYPTLLDSYFKAIWEDHEELREEEVEDPNDSRARPRLYIAHWALK